MAFPSYMLLLFLASLSAAHPDKHNGRQDFSLVAENATFLSTGNHYVNALVNDALYFKTGGNIVCGTINSVSLGTPLVQCWSSLNGRIFHYKGCFGSPLGDCPTLITGMTADEILKLHGLEYRANSEALGAFREQSSLVGFSEAAALTGSRFNGLLNDCVPTAVFNQAVAYKNLGLKIVVGSLGLGRGQNPFFEFGGRDCKDVRHFKEKKFADLHVWLQDSVGGVYDIFYPQYENIVAYRRGVPTTFRGKTVIEGMSIRELAEKGLHYVPASEMAQNVILKILYQKHGFKQPCILSAST